MVFKRRDTRSFPRAVAEWFWPRGGWARAMQYLRHRINRLPGTPEEIARGIFAGAFTIFTPLYGLHFFFAAFLAKLMRGNILAALLATFIGNPLTYVPISILSLRLGNWMLGRPPLRELNGRVFDTFANAGRDLWHNFKSIFTADRARWDDLAIFYDQIFFPWMVGGILPGIILGALCYYLSVPVIRAYKKRRSMKLRKKIAKLRTQAGSNV